IGAALGGLLVNAFETFFTSFAPDQWLFALGALFVAVTLFLPKGILGELDALRDRRREERRDRVQAALARQRAATVSAGE
ncbi:MAG: urea ABC transporter permease subunit UrtC, partial [Pseudomonadota bacterium]